MVDLQVIRDGLIFRGLSEAEVNEALAGLHAETRTYAKGEWILSAGQTTTRMGLVLQGSVAIESTDPWGNRTILSLVEKGQTFAETYALLADEVMLVDVRANGNTCVLFLSLSALRDPSLQTKSWHAAVNRNLLKVFAHKNLALSGRSFHTAPKTVRGRVMAYLSSVSLRCRRTEFDIPFDREQMAGYLNLDRSALSKELGRMRSEGLLSFRKNHFVLNSSFHEE